MGDFLVLRELGRGSFSRVYLAVETTAGDRPVALKVSAAGSREAETLGPLSHPHLIPVLSSRSAGAWTLVAMPFAGTATLEDVVSTVWTPDRTAPPLSAAVLLEAAACGGCADDPPFPACPAFSLHARMNYGDAVAAVAVGLFVRAVAYLHERGIAHRDLKPSNVLFGPNGYPYLLDFNLASRTADPWRLVGTLPYMAPEQLALVAEPDVYPSTDGRPGDVFACGVVLFELLTGRRPVRCSCSALAANSQGDRKAARLASARSGRAPDLAAALNLRVRWAVREAVRAPLKRWTHGRRPTAAELVELFSAHRVSPLVAGSRFLVLAGTGVLTPGAELHRSRDTLRARLLDAPVVSHPRPRHRCSGQTNSFESGLALYRQGKYALAAAGDFPAAGKRRERWPSLWLCGLLPVGRKVPR